MLTSLRFTSDDVRSLTRSPISVMTPVATEFDATQRMVVAALIGLGVGLEREWSGHTTGPNARFAGLRTTFLLGILGGVAGLLLASGWISAAAVAIGAGMALAVVAYGMTVRRADTEVDGTTEAAALAVVALGVLSGVGWMALAAGAGSIIVLALSEKTRLHWLVRRVSERELRAALQFAALALVVLPLLPAGPFGGALAIRPRAIWTIALFFSALNFIGFLARRAVGASAGLALTGVLGGLVSSTGVTLDHSRQSRRRPQLGEGLAFGVIGACTVLIPRVTIMSTILNREVGLRLCWLLWPPLLVGTALLALAWRRERHAPHAPEDAQASPLRLLGAIQMAVAFQVALTMITMVHARWGTSGVYPTAAVLGLTDVDALTVSMSRVDGFVTSTLAGNAIAIGVLANTLLKTALAATLGTGRFRRIAVGGLLLFAGASAVGLLLGTA